MLRLLHGLALVALVALCIPARLLASVLDTANLDRTCPACANFFQFANGGWVAHHPIPADSSTVTAFDDLASHNLQISHEILEDAAHDPLVFGDRQRIGDFYAACMNEGAAERAGIGPLGPLLGRIAAVNDLPSLTGALIELHRREIDSFFEATSAIDAKDSDREIAIIIPDGLSLPDRDYYTRNDDKSVKLRAQFGQHIAAIFVLAGDDRARAAAEAQSVLAIETGMAKVQLTNVERRDPNNTYHLITRTELARDAPHIDWDHYFNARGFPKFDDLNLSQVAYLEALDAQLASTPIEDLKAYLRWRVLTSYAPWLSKGFVNEDFAFASDLTGVKAQPVRWERCVNLIDAELGDALGRIWVAYAFPPQARARAQKMVGNLVAALRDDITTLPWMSDETRNAALAKLAAMGRKIGYPDRWRNYSGVTIDPGWLVDDIEHADMFDTKLEIAKIGKPVSHDDFGMTPETVNAYYSPQRNEIVFPAGVLQPPFFDFRADADDAMNYGSVGAIIGHELTHGFDDEGRRYDERGNLRDWWTPQDAAGFTIRAQCFIDEYSNFSVGDLKLNGQLVEGEAIADLGGLTIAYRAFEHAQASEPRVTIGGFTPEQRFFLGYAHVWAGQTRPESARARALSDPHPPDFFRVNGTVANMPEFAAAFGCKATDAMIRDDSRRCGLW
ncbi:MAG: M13 family metallopeptidase [Vulcanimicrobiaceae bacterium]